MRSRENGSRWSRVVAGAALAAGMVFAAGSAAEAREEYLGLAEAKYPVIVGTALDSCALCHRVVPRLNVYGRAWREANRSFDAIRRRDSDGDGFRNLREINAGTFPGRRASHP